MLVEFLFELVGEFVEGFGGLVFCFLGCIGIDDYVVIVGCFCFVEKVFEWFCLRVVGY